MLLPLLAGMTPRAIPRVGGCVVEESNPPRWVKGGRFAVPRWRRGREGAGGCVGPLSLFSWAFLRGG